VVTFESLGTASYLPSIVTMAVSVAVCEIFSVKEWRDLENQVRGGSRSLKMAPFDRPYATFYWSSIVSILIQKTSEVLSLLRPIDHGTSKTAKITWFILVLHWAVDVIEVLYYICGPVEY